jgi:hypothetical protein
MRSLIKNRKRGLDSLGGRRVLGREGVQRDTALSLLLAGREVIRATVFGTCPVRARDSRRQRTMRGSREAVIVFMLRGKNVGPEIANRWDIHRNTREVRGIHVHPFTVLGTGDVLDEGPVRQRRKLSAQKENQR